MKSKPQYSLWHSGKLLAFLMIAATLVTPVYAKEHAQENAQEQVQAEPLVPQNWDVELELVPIVGEETVQSLVPKQTVRMKLSVWYPSTTTWINKYPDWDMPGASIERTKIPGYLLEREKDGVLQYGHIKNFFLTPMDIGKLKLTQEHLDVSPNQDGSELVPLSRLLELQVDLPEQFYSLDTFLPAYGLEVEQAFYHYTNSAEPKWLELDEVNQLTLQKGEMLERRITQTAKGIKGSVIPVAPVADEQDGLQRESRYEDIEGIFGFEAGQRVDAFYYLPGQGGKVELAPFDIQWWNLEKERAETISIGGGHFDSVKVETYEEAIALNWWEKFGGQALTWLAYTVLAIGFVAIGLRASKTVVIKVGKHLKRLLAQVKNSEQLLFSKLVFALLTGCEQKGRGLLLTWLRRVGHHDLPQTLAIYMEAAYQPHGEKPKPNAAQLAGSCLKLRKTVFAKATPTHPFQLPEL